MIRVTLLCVYTLFFFQNSKAQEPLVAYAASSFKDGVLISFTMRGGFSCNGINIERSEDSVSFSVIGDIEGICGSPDFDVAFTFTDASPLPNRTNYYRLDMKQLGYSPVMSVFYTKLNTEGVLVFPNPCIEQCKLFFDNPQREKTGVELFQSERKIIELVTDKNFMVFEMQHYSAGVYHYVLKWPDGKMFQGKLVKVTP